MADEDVTKGKKKRRRRSARVYVNANKPLAVNVPEIAALFPPDEDDDDGQAAAVGKRHISQADRKRLAREGNAIVNPDGHVSYPVETVEDLHNAATLARTGHGDVEAARRLIARRAKELGVANPLASEKAIAAAGNPFSYPDGRNPLDRVSPSRVTGGASPSSGDHGASCDPMNMPGPRELAFRHPDMRNGTTTPWPLAAMRTDADAFPADLRGVSNGVPVALTRLDAAAAAGMPSAPGNPFSRPGDHSAPTGSASNGGHTLNDPRSHAAPMAAKAMTPFQIMRQNQRRV